MRHFSGRGIPGGPGGPHIAASPVVTVTATVAILPDSLALADSCRRRVPLHLACAGQSWRRGGYGAHSPALGHPFLRHYVEMCDAVRVRSTCCAVPRGLCHRLCGLARLKPRRRPGRTVGANGGGCAQLWRTSSSAWPSVRRFGGAGNAVAGTVAHETLNGPAAN